MVDDGGVEVRESECPSCRRLFCARCQVPWHDGVSCEEFLELGKDEREKEDIMVMKLAKDKSWRRCPNCKIFVEKTEGCLHMTCRLNNVPSTSEPKPKRCKTNDHDGTSQSQGSKPKNMLDGWVLCKVYRLARDVEVEALNQEEQHLHQEEEQHQAIEQPVALNIGAKDHVLIPAIEDSFEHLQRNHQEEQHLHQEEQHQAIALNIGANDHVLIPAIEDSFEHLQRNHQEKQHQAIALNIGANDHVLIPAIEDSFENLQRNRQEEQHLQQEEQHQAIALNNGDNHHLLIPEIEDSFEHQQRNEDMPRFSQEDWMAGCYICKVYKLGRDVAAEAPILVAQEEHDQVVVHAQEEHNQVVHAQEEHNHQVVHAQEEHNQVVPAVVALNEPNYAIEDIIRHLELDEDVLHHPRPTDDPLLNSTNLTWT
uniref:RBR-type E3 ubiquitin transferase n=1 Tax=Chenopodium quinoa TaxID=63459 RepID=A0A803KQW1_CHEQI